MTVKTKKVKQVAILSVLVIYQLMWLFNNSICVAEESTGQIQRTQEILEKEKALRARLEDEKVFIKRIIVQGANLSTEEKIKQMILPFQKRWLTKKDILQIKDAISQIYQQEGYREQLVKITYKIINKELIFRVAELVPSF